MNKKTGTLLFTIICNIFLFSGTIKAQINDAEVKPINISDKVRTKELILGVPKISEKTLYQLIDVIEQTNGLKYNSFCTKHKLVLLNYDPAKYTRPEDVVQAISDQDFNLLLLIKQGAFREAKEMCSQN